MAENYKQRRRHSVFAALVVIMSDFYVTLPSNVQLGPGFLNTSARWRTTLPKRLELKGEWEVGLVDLQYPFSWTNIGYGGNGVSTEDLVGLRLYLAFPDFGPRDVAVQMDALDFKVVQVPSYEKTFKFAEVHSSGVSTVFEGGRHLPWHGIDPDYWGTIWPGHVTYMFQMYVASDLYISDHEELRGIITDGVESILDVVIKAEAEHTKMTVAELSEIRDNMFKLEYQTGMKKFKMSLSTYCPRVSLSPRLAYMFGFKVGVDIQGEEIIAPYPPDLTGGMNYMYIYCDALQPQIVGDTMAPLLRAIGLRPEKYKWGSVVHEIFTRPHYIPISRNYLTEILIELKDDQDRPIKFKFGKSIVNLHFRPKQNGARLG